MHKQLKPLFGPGRNENAGEHFTQVGLSYSRVWQRGGVLISLLLQPLVLELLSSSNTTIANSCVSEVQMTTLSRIKPFFFSFHQKIQPKSFQTISINWSWLKCHKFSGKKVEKIKVTLQKAPSDSWSFPAIFLLSVPSEMFPHYPLLLFYDFSDHKTGIRRAWERDQCSLLTVALILQCKAHSVVSI